MCVIWNDWLVILMTVPLQGHAEFGALSLEYDTSWMYRVSSVHKVGQCVYHLK